MGSLQRARDATAGGWSGNISCVEPLIAGMMVIGGRRNHISQ
jgi:hypothetical protein